MNKNSLTKHISNYVEDSKKDKEKFAKDLKEREEIINFYQSFSEEKIASMMEDEIYQYLSKLWAMIIWGNKHYVVDKIIEDNGLENFKENLARLVWAPENIETRWDDFRKEIKGMSPAMNSQILCKTHPNDFMLWYRRAYVGLDYLEVENLPRYGYQLTGKLYNHLCGVCKEISEEIKRADFKDASLLAVDYFIWDQLQVADNLSKIYVKEKEKKVDIEF